MNALLGSILDAHGGLARWRQYESLQATIVSGGGLFSLKGMTPDASPRRMTAQLHEERTSVTPFGAPDQRGVFTPDRAAIEKLDGSLVAERHAPRDAFAGHQMNTPWDPLHRAYFNGEAMWTYFTTPFILAMDGVRVEEIEPWREGAETWRRLRAYFPGWIETHSLIQEFFFWRGSETAPSRLSSEHRGWIFRCAAHFSVRDGGRHQPAHSPSRLRSRSRCATRRAHANGSHRYFRCALPIASIPPCAQANTIAPLERPSVIPSYEGATAALRAGSC